MLDGRHSFLLHKTHLRSPQLPIITPVYQSSGLTISNHVFYNRTMRKHYNVTTLAHLPLVQSTRNNIIKQFSFYFPRLVVKILQREINDLLPDR
jgi:hypothetical protein